MSRSASIVAGWVVLLASVVAGSIGRAAEPAPTVAPIRPYAANPYYWEYKGEPVLLLGGSKDDNLFQIPDLREHLDEMRAVGANYIRNTMSDRPDKGFEIYAFKKLENGKYDLNQWNDEYWQRFANMLEWTHERDIIVQIELWDRFDFADSTNENWIRHPFNPQNNVNYTAKESGLKKTYRKHPGSNENPFFFSVPKLNNNTTVLKYQQAHIEKMLSYSLRYPNVLYCMDNETGALPEWGRYWATLIRQHAEQQGTVAQVTEMWDDWNLNAPHHRETFDHPDLYTFVDVSQNNHQKGQRHWDNFQTQRTRIAELPRPMNNVKIYGADTGRFGNARDGQERFWRNIFGGAASSRFHRPDSGLGLSDVAKSHLKSARMLMDELDIFRAQPDSDSRLLGDRDPNEAFLTRIPGESYAVFFPNGGAVTLDLSEASGSFNRKWLDVLQSQWNDSDAISGGRKVELRAPEKGFWVVLLSKNKK